MQWNISRVWSKLEINLGRDFVSELLLNYELFTLGNENIINLSFMQTKIRLKNAAVIPVKLKISNQPKALHI